MTFGTFQAKFMECEEEVVIIVVLKIAAVVAMFMAGVAVDPQVTNK